MESTCIHSYATHDTYIHDSITGDAVLFLVLPEGSDTSSADYRALEAVLKRRFVPNHVLVVSFEGGAKQLHEHVPWAKGKPPRNDKATAYVCERGACELPTNEPHTLSRQLDKFADFPMGVGLR